MPECPTESSGLLVRAVHFVCGAVFGVLVGLFAFSEFLVPGSVTVGCALVAIPAVLCGAFAACLGHRFWKDWADWF